MVRKENSCVAVVVVLAFLAGGGSLRAAAPTPVRSPDKAGHPGPIEQNHDQGRLLETVEQHNRVVTQQVETDAVMAMRRARQIMRSDPAAVNEELKLLLGQVLRTPELRAEVRSTLRSKLEAALREASRVAATKDILDHQQQEAQAAALDRLRIGQNLDRKQEKLKQLMDRFDSLMDEGRYIAADEIGEREVGQLAPELPIAQSATLVAHMTGAHEADLALRLARQKAVIDTLGTVEVAMMPMPDDQPIVYPPADEFQELSTRRKRYATTDLKKQSPAEKKIREALEAPTQMEFTETPLQDAVGYLKDLHGVEIQLDTRAMEDAGVGTDTPVSRVLNGVSLKSALRLLLGEYDLTFIVKDEVLLITTQDKAEAELVTKAYPVADLVILVRLGRGMGGGMMGGGMMGGGMMGGMGGGGMGGGGMGGMGGGMGGGMF